MLESYYHITNATGVSIHISSDGIAEIYACGVSVSGNRLEIESKVLDLHSLEELVRSIAPKSYIALNITGKGVLHKQIEATEDIDANNFAQLLPNASFEDFYIQNFISGDRSFISIVRKEEVDKWVNSLNQLGFITLKISFGPFPVQNIFRQLNVYNNEFVFNGHIVQRDDKLEWLTYRYNDNAKSPFLLKIESETIDEKLIIAYANAFQLVLKSKIKSIHADAPALTSVLLNVLADKKLKVRGFIILTVFFVLLLLNFMVLTYLNKSNIQLTDQVSHSAQSINDIQGIDAKVKLNEALLKDLGWDSGISKSKLVDEIAGLLPPEVVWSTVIVNPIDQTNSHAQKAIEFIDRKIKVTGSAQKIIPVNEWIARIKTKKWAKNVHLESYLYNNDLNTGRFIVLIDY